MASGCFIFGLLFLAAAQASFVEIGKEYEYAVVAHVGAGTYDYVPHGAGVILKMKARMQAESDTSIKAELSDLQSSEFVGKKSDKHDHNFESSEGKFGFGITLDNGLFKSLALPAVSTAKKNTLKAFASIFQLNGMHMQEGHQAFKSPEQTIHGNCDVSYVVTSDTIYKNINIEKDCKDRAVRRVDDVRGFECEGPDHEKAEGFVSTSNTIYTYEKLGSANKITKIIKNGALVSQLFGTEGVSHIVKANITMTLVAVRDNPGDIQAGSDMTDTVRYEFSDGEYKWNKDRDLKAAEPFSFSSDSASNDQGVLKEMFVKILTEQKDILANHETSHDKLDDAHRHGVETLRLPLMAMNYDTLKALYDELHADKSASGVMKCNIFTELLGSTGTTASAMVVLDLIKEKKFDNHRDAARTLTSVPFHIRRPNAQLVGEFESILHSDEEENSLVKMAIPLAFAHLVRITCERAGQHFSEEHNACFKDLGMKWTEHFFGKFKASNSREDRNHYLSAILNVRFGGQMKILKPLIYGEIEGATSEERSMAVYAASWDVAVHKKTGEFFLPIYADRKNNHEVRITALNAIMRGKPSMADMSGIVAVLKTETDYEVINMVFASLEALASSISPCDHHSREVAGFFLKYLKQFSKYEVDWGFGVSKMYVRQFNQRKYGYGGSYKLHTVGSHDSTTPLFIGMGISNYNHHSYTSDFLYLHLRIEGVAKGLIRKFKNMDPGTWKTEDLTAILKDEMKIKERPDQPIRAQAMVAFKGTIVICRGYDSDSRAEGGKLGEFLKKLQSLGSAYSINHQRVIQAGQLTVEQPTDIGIPAILMGSLSALISFKADVKRGSQRGLMYREVDYHYDSFAQGRTAAMVFFSDRKKLYGIVQDRIYTTHSPRKVVIGVNPIKKVLKLKVSRAEYDHPTMFMMHSRTSVMIRSANFEKSLKKDCPSCGKSVVVSAGEGAEKTRTIVDRECEKHGYRLNAEYFDCEMNVARTNTVGRALAAFMPYNKNPKTAWNSISMGLRQVRAFLLFYPRAEKCGLVAKWSQSRANPVREIELSVSVSKSENGERLFLRGSTLKVVATLKATGDHTRAYRLTFNKESTPGDLINKVKVKIDRAAVAALGIKPYVVCIGHETKYPPFSNEMFNVEMDKPLKMTGKALLQYGEGTSCSGGQGEITAAFEYSTTQEARESLKKKYYYQQCMKLKETDAWKGREALPISSACRLTGIDASNARRYKYDIKFTKLTDRAKAIIANLRGIARAVMLRFFEIETVDTDVGPFLKLDVTFKDGDSLADVIVETSRGTKKISDHPLRLNWAKRLRNLKFPKTALRLHKMGLIKPCITTSTYVHTMDNVTYTIGAPDCWTLVSGHCSPSPSYAVFTKKNSGNTPLAMKAYIGGHAVEIDADAGSATIDGKPVAVSDSEEHKHKLNNVEIFKITKWGSTFNIYSFMKVWISFDGNFISVVPAPSVTGQHCGLCGNYNRNKYDETTGKDGVSLISGGYAQMTEEWKWKC